MYYCESYYRNELFGHNATLFKQKRYDIMGNYIIQRTDCNCYVYEMKHHVTIIIRQVKISKCYILLLLMKIAAICVTDVFWCIVVHVD